MELRFPGFPPRISDDDLRRLAGQGHNVNQIARIAGYSQYHARKRLDGIGLQPKPCPRIPEETIGELADGTRTVRQITEIIGGNHVVIVAKIRKLGLRAEKASHSISPEGCQRDEEIAHPKSQGLTFKTIGKKLGMSTQRACKRYRRHKRNAGTT